MNALTSNRSGPARRARPIRPDPMLARLLDADTWDVPDRLSSRGLHTELGWAGDRFQHRFQDMED